jgi:hypothetical protein
LKFFITNNLVEKVLAEKAESVADWKKIELLAQQIAFPDTKTKEFAEASATYGRIKYSVMEQAWTILLYGEMGDASKNYDYEKISAAIAEYDKLWTEWRALKAQYPNSCATIYKDVAYQGKPGIGAAVERYRKICETEKNYKPIEP